MIPRTFARPSRAAYALAGLLVLAVAATTLGQPDHALAFPEETETQGEIDTDLNGVWLVVHNLKFNRPTPQATPGAQAEQVSTTRFFNVLNIFKMTHLKKEEAQKARDAHAAKLKASVARAKELIAEGKAGGSLPVQTDEGEVEGGPRIVVPEIPRAPGYDPKIHSGDQVEIFLLDVTMPKSVEDSFQAAQKAEAPYEPSDKDLAVLRSSWDKLESKEDTEYSRIEWKIQAPEYYDQSLQIDPKLANTKFTITGTQGMIPRPSQPNRNIVVYGIRDAEDGVLSGTHSRAMMATAPFPIPIEMGGTAKLIKIADLPEGEGPARASTDEKASKSDEPKPDKTGQPAS